MLDFKSITAKKFLAEYWQKKPLVLRQALPASVNTLSPNELAGLALEDYAESRLVIETPGLAPYWQLTQGPFLEEVFLKLPKTHWTLLVQGVDRLVPEVAALLDNFDFLPQWRVDDVMISYAVKQGSVGPHYDNYDVFLFQASGQRKWLLTTQHCHPSNYLNDVPLRIMQDFIVEEEHILEPGDVLYLPPHVAHHGISLDDDCMTYSFGYRSYQGQELLDSFADYASEHATTQHYYRDPKGSLIDKRSCIPNEAWQQAKELIQAMLTDESQMKTWFGSFATRIDACAEQHMPEPLDDLSNSMPDFIDLLKHGSGLQRDATCRIAYDESNLFINGRVWDISYVDFELVKLVANHRFLPIKQLLPYLIDEKNQDFLYQLWILQWIVIAS